MRIKKYLSLLLVVLISLSLFGCGAKKEASMTADYADGFSVTQSNGSSAPAVKPEMNYGSKGVEAGVSNDSVSNNTDTTKEKLIKSIRVTMETKEYEKTVTSLEKLVIDMGGYIQNSNVPRNPNGEKYSGLRASFSFMVPTTKIEEFLNATSGLGSVTNTSRNVENVTDAYMDIENHIKNLELKEQRLQELLKQSGSLNDLLQIENSISNTRYEIDRYKSTIQNYDKRIAYTAISVDVNEVYTYTPKSEKQTLWQRISSEFSNSFEDFKYAMEELAVWIIGVLPFLIIRLVIFAIPLFAIFLIIKKVRLNMKNKKNNAQNNNNIDQETDTNKK